MTARSTQTGPPERDKSDQIKGPWGGQFTIAVQNVGKEIWEGLGFGGTRDLKQWERNVLYDSGYRKSGSNKWTNPQTGDVIKGREKAIKAARRLREKIPLPGGDSNVLNPPVPSVDYRYAALFGVPSQADWLRKKKALAKKKKPKRKFLAGKQLPPAAKAALARAAARYPRVARALEVGRGNVYLAAAILGIDYAIGYGVEKWRDYRKWKPESIKITAKRMKDPLAGKLSRVRVTAKPLPDPVARPSPAPRTTPRTTPTPRTMPTPTPRDVVIREVEVKAGRMTDPLAGPLETVRVTARRKAVPGWRAKVAARASTIYRYGSMIANSPLWQAYQSPAPKTKSPWSPSPVTAPSPVGSITPLTAYQPQPLASAAKCKCPKPKKRKTGPRKRRTVCYKGSYVETASGLRKRRREQIPC